MKTFISSFFVCLLLLSTIWGADDFIKGVDFTGGGVSTSRLNQLVDNATVTTNRGLVIYTNSAPSSAFSRYLWMDYTTTIPTVKVYSLSGGGWSNITATAVIAANSVGQGALQQNAVSRSNLVDNIINSDKLEASSVVTSKIASGNVTSNSIGQAVISSYHLVQNAVVSSNITDAAIIASKLAPNSVGVTNLQSGFALQGTNIAPATVTSNNIAEASIALTNLASSPTGLYAARANAANTGFEWARPGLIQMITTNTGSYVGLSGTLYTVDGNTVAPTTSDGVQIFSLTITPKSASSKLRITCKTPFGCTSAANITTAVYIPANSADAIAATAIYLNGSTWYNSCNIDYSMTSGTTDPITFTVRIMGSANTAGLNGRNTAAAALGGVGNASFTIEEIL